jgi:hypothetical protein
MNDFIKRITLLRGGLLVAMLIVLGGCADPYRRADIKDFQAVESGQKGAVLFMVTQDQWSILFKTRPIGLSYRFVRLLDDQRQFGYPFFKYRAETTQGTFVNASANYADSMLFVEPGVYSIQKVELLEEANFKHWYDFPVVGKQGVISCGAFEAKKGEILSLGRLDVTDGGFQFIRESEKIREDLVSAGYHDLISKVKEGVFYERGSVIHPHGDKDGVIRVDMISLEEMKKTMDLLIDEAGPK